MAELIVIPWHGRELRVRHDDPRLSSYSGSGQQLQAAMWLASDVEGVRIALTTAMGREYEVKGEHDGSTVGLWPRT